MTSNRRSKRARPSYEDGRFREPRIEEKRDDSYRSDELKRLIRKASKPRKTKEDS